MAMEMVHALIGLVLFEYFVFQIFVSKARIKSGSH